MVKIKGRISSSLLFVKVAYILLEGRFGLMARSSSYLCDPEATKDIVCCKGSSGGVAANKFPLFLVLDFDMSVDLGFSFD